MAYDENVPQDTNEVGSDIDQMRENFSLLGDLFEAIGITVDDSSFEFTANNVQEALDSLDNAENTDAIQDLVAAFISWGDKLSGSYDDSAGTLTVSTSALDQEEVDDFVASMVQAGNAISISRDDASDQITISVDESAISHDNISDVSPSDHHDKTTSSEIDHANVSNVQPNQHEDTALYDSNGNKVAEVDADGNIDVLGNSIDNQLSSTNSPNLSLLGSVSDATALPQPHDISVANGYAYVVGRVSSPDGAFAIIDISDPSNPTVSSYITGLEDPQTVEVAGDFAFVGEDGTFHSYFIGHPQNIFSKGSVSLSGTGGQNGTVIWQDWAFVSQKDGYIDIIDISDPANPTLVDTYDASTNDDIDALHDIDIFYDHLVVCNRPNTHGDGTGPHIAIYNALNASRGEPKPASSWTLDSSITNTDLDKTNRIRVQDHYAYGIGYRLSVIDIEDQTNITLEKTISMDNGGYGLAIRGDYLCTTDNEDVEIYDISNRTSPTKVSSITLSGIAGTSRPWIHDMEYYGNLILTTDDPTDRVSVLQIDYSEFQAIKTGELRTGSFHADGRGKVKSLDVLESLQVQGRTIAQARPVIFSAYQSTSQNIQSGRIEFDSEHLDPRNLYDSTTGNSDSGKFRAPESGLYLFFTNVEFDNLTSGEEIRIRFQKNGSDYKELFDFEASTGFNGGFGGGAFIPLVRDDTVSVSVQLDSTLDTNTFNSSVTWFMGIKLMHNPLDL